MAINIRRTSDILHDSRNNINFLRLSYIILPSFIAFTIVPTLSTVKIMSLDSLLTSVPTIPIATPMSAFLSDGASLIPSPVIATICWFFFRASTIITLLDGVIYFRPRRIDHSDYTQIYQVIFRLINFFLIRQIVQIFKCKSKISHGFFGEFVIILNYFFPVGTGKFSNFSIPEYFTAFSGDNLGSSF